MQFRHLGRSRSGVDCAGLVVCAYKDAGMHVRDSNSYGAQPSTADMLRHMETHLLKVHSPMDGDVLAFQFDNPHCGILDGAGFWHAYRHRNVLWTPFRGAWRKAHVATFGVAR